jgi:hypothetical protein
MFEPYELEDYYILSDNFINKEHNYEDNTIITKQNELSIQTNKNILIVTHILEKPNQKYIHYSMIKGYLLANGLLNMGYNIYFMSDIENIQKWNDYYYIHHNMLDIDTLYNFDMIIFGLHNPDIVTEIYNDTNVINNILLMQKSKEKRPIIVNKTCTYPIIFDKLNIDSYNFFDAIFLQTSKVVLPKQIFAKLNLKVISNNNNNLKKILKLSKEQKKTCKLYWSEMTFNIETLNDSDNCTDIQISNNVINLVYMGRLNPNQGFDILYLIKIMKRLGKKYKLYILPGSFCLPTDNPPQKYYLDSEENFLKLKNFVEEYKLKWSKHNVKKFNFEYPRENFLPEKNDYNICNIEVFRPIEYGEHSGILRQMDIGLSFSPNKMCNVSVGSSKLFDYMSSNIKIVSEDGCHNTQYIKKYKFGKIVSRKSNINEMIEAIKQVEKMPKKDILYDKFINEHNHIRRAQKLVKNVYRIVDELRKNKFLITDKKETSDEKSEYNDQEIAEQLLMSNEDVNYISNS